MTFPERKSQELLLSKVKMRENEAFIIGKDDLLVENKLFYIENNT